MIFSHFPCYFCLYFSHNPHSKWRKFHIILVFPRKLNRRDCKKPKQILLSDINNIQEKEMKYWCLIKVFSVKN